MKKAIASIVLINESKRQQEKIRNNKQNTKRKKFVKKNLSNLDDSRAILEFRFTVVEINRICRAFDLPQKIRVYIAGKDRIPLLVEREFALAMLLYRLSYMRRLEGMDEYFGMSSANISKTLKELKSILVNKIKYGIQLLENQFSTENKRRFSKAIFEKGAVYPNIVGFIDGTMQQVCRPVNDIFQNLLYNGWKHVHCLKYQAIVTPDGITSSLLGPFPGSHNDIQMFNESHTRRMLQKYLNGYSDGVYALYGDGGYNLSRHLYKPYPNVTNDEDEQLANKTMKSVRVTVEMEFGKVEQYFLYSKIRYGMKLSLTGPGEAYILSTVFKNIHTCLHGSATSKYFGLDPPSLEDYISGLMREKLPTDVDLFV